MRKRIRYGVCVCSSIEDSWHVAEALGSVLSDFGMVVTGPTSTIMEAERLTLNGNQSFPWWT